MKEAIQDVVDLVKNPYYAFRDSLNRAVRNVKQVAKRIKILLTAIKRIVLVICKYFKILYLIRFTKIFLLKKLIIFVNFDDQLSSRLIKMAWFMLYI